MYRKKCQSRKTSSPLVVCSVHHGFGIFVPSSTRSFFSLPFLLNTFIFSPVFRLSLLGLLVLCGTFASIPLLMQKRHANHNLSAKQTPLTGSQIMRGAYINSGSKDIGPDPDWDMKRGIYLGSSGQRFSPDDDDITKARMRLEENKRIRFGESSD